MKKANRQAPNPARGRAAGGAPLGMRSGVCYCAGVGPRMTALTSGMLQGPVFDHFRTAGVEVLLGLRAILDAQIDALTRKPRKGTKVPVE